MKKTEFKEHLKYIVIIMAIIIFLSSKVEVGDSDGLDKVSGQLSKDSNIVKGENVDIKKTELRECCSFINKEGNNKSCYVMERFSCDYCSEIC